MPGAMVSYQKHCDSLNLPLFHGLALILTSPLWALLAVDMGQLGDSDQPKMLCTVHSETCLLQLLFETPQASQCSIMCSQPWMPMTLSLVHQLSFFGPHLLNTNQCMSGTMHKTCSFGDALTQSFSHHNLVFVKDVHILMLSDISCFQHIIFKK